MSGKASELARKRAALVAQIAVERASLSQQGAALRPAALTVDRIIAGVRYVKRNPVVLLLPLAILSLRRPRHWLALAIRGFGVWRLLQSRRRRLRP